MIRKSKIRKRVESVKLEIGDNSFSLIDTRRYSYKGLPKNETLHCSIGQGGHQNRFERGFQNFTDVWHFTQFLTNKKSELNTSTHQEFEREATPPPDEVASKKRQTKIQKNIRKIEADMKGALAETAIKAPINGRANESLNLSQDRITDPVPFRL